MTPSPIAKQAADFIIAAAVASDGSSTFIAHASATLSAFLAMGKQMGWSVEDQRLALAVITERVDSRLGTTDGELAAVPAGTTIQ